MLRCGQPTSCHIPQSATFQSRTARSAQQFAPQSQDNVLLSMLNRSCEVAVEHFFRSPGKRFQSVRGVIARGVKFQDKFAGERTLPSTFALRAKSNNGSAAAAKLSACSMCLHNTSILSVSDAKIQVFDRLLSSSQQVHQHRRLPRNWRMCLLNMFQDISLCPSIRISICT